MRKSDLIVLILIIAGIADAAYLSLVELNAVPLYCTTSGILNCGAVESSAYSFIMGIPIAYGGLAWFIIALLLFVIATKSSVMKTIKKVWYVLGTGAAAYSLISMYALKEICEYCILLDVLLIAMVVITLYKPE